MKKLRQPDGARRGRIKVKCNVCGVKNETLFYITVTSKHAGNEVSEAVCLEHLEQIEQTCREIDDYDMEWRVLEEHEYETSA